MVGVGVWAPWSARLWRSLILAAIVSLLVVTVAACGGLDARRDAAGAAARGFRQALGARDGAKACAVLAPQTKHELEQSGGKSCGRAVLEESIPDGDGPALRVDVYGRQALVTFAGDVVFVAEFGDAWKVAAAGCKPRQQGRYDCMVKGG